MRKIPENVQQFIIKHIGSADEIEILLLLNDNPEKEWGSLAISRSLHIERALVESIVRALESAKFVICRDLSGECLCRADQSNPVIVATLNELSKWYSTHRVKILTLIYTKPMDKVQMFADAFRFRKEQDK